MKGLWIGLAIVGELLRPTVIVWAFGALSLMVAAAPRPNIVVFLADNHGFADSEVCDSSELQTPDLLRLAAAGLTFHEHEGMPAALTWLDRAVGAAQDAREERAVSRRQRQAQRRQQNSPGWTGEGK